MCEGMADERRQKKGRRIVEGIEGGKRRGEGRMRRG